MNNKPLTCLFISLLCASEPTAFAANNARQTTQQLKQIKNKMGQLEKTITSAVNNRQNLYQTLATTEKEISRQIQTLYSTKTDIQKKQQEIQNTTLTINQLSHDLGLKQQALSLHLRVRYQMENIHPLQWLFDQQKPKELSRFLTYYQYLIRSDETLIQAVREAKNNLTHTQNQLKLEYSTLKTLEQTLIQHQKKLTETKQHHHKVIEALNDTIQNKQQILTTYKQDQARLHALLEQLSRASQITRTNVLAHPHSEPSIAATNVRFSAKLSSPLKGNNRTAKPLNQGMLFPATEGTPVSAVLPGKVVFSDWLNGYGLLLIIDHGQGTMSLYAHNESLFKSKGAMVKPGEQIASVGHTGGIRENGLYFELRRRGKAVPPRQWLA